MHLEWKILKLLMVILSFWQIRLGCNERILKELNAYDNKCSQWRAQILQSKKIYFLIPSDIIFIKKVFVMVSCNIFLFIRYRFFFLTYSIDFEIWTIFGITPKITSKTLFIYYISLLYQFFFWITRLYSRIMSKTSYLFKKVAN